MVATFDRPGSRPKKGKARAALVMVLALVASPGFGRVPEVSALTPVSFDQDGLAAVPLAIEVTLASVNATQASGTVTCNREVSVTVQAIITQDNSPGASASADIDSCGPEATPWSGPLSLATISTSYLFPLTPGPASYDLFASADEHSNNEWVTFEVSGTVEVTDITTYFPAPDTADGATITNVRQTQTATGPAIVADIQCDWATPLVLDASLAQRGDPPYGGFGDTNEQSITCNGSVTVTIPLAVVLPGAFAAHPREGEALLQFTVRDDTIFGPKVYARVERLIDVMGVPVDRYSRSRIDVTGASTSVVAGEVRCDRATRIDVTVEVRQWRKDSSNRADGTSSTACVDGVARFAVDVAGDLDNGRTVVKVWVDARNDDGSVWQGRQKADIVSLPDGV